MDNCMICDRIELIKSGENPYFVRELNTGYVVIGDCQRIRGYSLFLCKEHATELHFLESEFRARFLWEMSLVAEAVYRAPWHRCGRAHALAFFPEKSRGYAEARPCLAAWKRAAR